LFKEGRYLQSIVNGGNTWMLQHMHYFTIEAWARLDIDAEYDP
jgi:hypothetical protein